MALLIRGGRIVTATDDHVADIYCQQETITRIEPRIEPGTLPPGTEVIDARGKYVFPGFIDPHVHIYLPFMGTYAADDYEAARKAAVEGGTTPLIEMICPGPTDEPVAAFELCRSKAEQLAAVDYAFHMSVVRFDEAVRGQFREIVKAGVASFKVFLAYKGALNLSDEHLFEAMTLAKQLGVIVTAHCENADAIDVLQRRLLAAGKTGPEWHGPSRPPVIEASGVHHPSSLADLLGTHVYIVHISSHVTTSVTDHAPSRFPGQKDMGKDAFAKIPNGIPSIQERVDLLHTYGVAPGRLSLQAMVDACSTQAARLFGLYPKKGAIQVGSDADLVVYDPAFRGTFSQECSYSNVDYNAYEGWERKGRPSVVTVRGQVQARDGEFVGTIGRGQFLKREPTHF